MSTRAVQTSWEIWRMPVLLTILSVVVLVIGLLADGVADAVAYVGLGIPVAVAIRHLGRAIRS